ncbi:SRPBCC family protein [Pseudonocardia alni]|uniref:Polyketide cyclase/dehydrase/lipid transport protein n=1 Tax=Pseudonocardia alni TaxID=33907 RepID=A0A852VY38_PSEA5|nr:MULTISPECIES: SRPBCC family protein [Pseudonocardia]MYW75807.1 polyketide cyclase [Pseudonocardia sp. SID8383]NWJ72742.1 SRPBCC family protein [Pseudonocardia pini]OJG08564.1 Polyketide cyclase / dehydrase and lipid transport [Pseudonocardia autotrophica]MBO4239969.1 polyketide cyclase [Pseudonocardia alni]MCO7191677.1 SRPBCC family protein [Pseudonocardia sp. McavD-2-B]
MVGVQRVMTVSTPAETVLGYLADHGHSEIWDPTVRSSTRSDGGGPVAVGAAWHTVSVWGGRESELDHTLRELTAGRVVFVGENPTVTATEEIVVEPAEGGGSVVSFHARVRLKGLLKLAAPFLRREFERHGDELERTLPPVLERLQGPAPAPPP